MGEPDDTIDEFSFRSRLQRALPYLLFATIMVTAAVIIARPWEETLPAGEGAMGVIAQIPHPGGEDIDTLAHLGKLAPNFRLESLSGEMVQMADLRGKPVFLNFWATWCFSCVTEMPAMQRVADSFGDDLMVVGVNVGEDADDALSFASGNDIRYTLLLDPNQEVTREYLVRAMPTSLFVRPDGVVDSVRYGVITETEMRSLIEPLFAQTGQQPEALNSR